MVLHTSTSLNAACHIYAPRLGNSNCLSHILRSEASSHNKRQAVTLCQLASNSPVKSLTSAPTCTSLDAGIKQKGCSRTIKELGIINWQCLLRGASIGVNMDNTDDRQGTLSLKLRIFSAMKLDHIHTSLESKFINLVERLVHKNTHKQRTALSTTSPADDISPHLKPTLLNTHTLARAAKLAFIIATIRTCLITIALICG
mmetsp:Transcript_16685/g.32376  ORF Transcript_16685/g.32376 Transcript_16685/m.32376 type:complete len:201 (-) Transcript_16685:1273-1875(-)